MYSKYAIVFLAATVPGLAQAATAYQCSFDGMQRRIEILTEPGVTVPCEVHYYKDTELPGQNQVLWTADTDAAYCETKAQEFAAKLGEWGWDCVISDGAASAAELSAEAEPDPEVEPEPDAETEPAPVSDDTEALQPAD